MKETTDDAQHMLEKAMGEHAIKDIRDPKVIGLGLALSSSAFIGASFVLTRMALQRASLKPGISARAGGFSYMKEPMWWLAMGTMLFGELANFSAYAYAPAVLVTPLGAISIITTALLADCILGERLHACGMAGCFCCIIGSMVLVSASPQEQMLTSVEEIWAMATQPTFVVYVIMALLLVCILMGIAPMYGESQVLVYVCICSLMGSLSVVSCKALGVALKLTFRGSNQLMKPETYAFAASVAVCVAAQLNYLNKALDTFNTAMVSSIYYVLFTVCTITASTIMYKDWKNQTVSSIWNQALGFVIIVFGVYALNVTKESEPGCRFALFC
uniref:Magnesium transporter n=1 Tax=Prymnesium polylepis TaxID=72548 RepID=A0A6T7YWG7_9EUKA